MKCQTCGVEKKRMAYDKETFKQAFKVGDTISGFSTGKHMLITAIGETRFLYLNDWDRNTERVCKFYTSNWLLVKRKEENK